ncbi:MAG TPA: SCO family protein [Vicinamibacterales bacterium]|nr:SCO family protein [Vicinamibacterales bacterium]
MLRRRRLALVCLVIFVIAGASRCGPPAEQQRTYPLRGQILSIGEPRADGRREMSVKHEDIPGFMPAMSMAYFVRNPAMLDGLQPGDLVSATLVIAGSDIHLDDVKKTGHADLPPGSRPVRVMEVMNAGDQVPDDALVDQEGRARTLSDWRGKSLAVTFVYTRCPLPDFCPLMDRRFADVQRAIAADPALRERAHLVSISFDPAHDTPDVIRKHAALRGADPKTWSYVTGTRASIDHLTSRFGVSTIDEQDTAQSITHNLRTAIVDPQGRLVKMYSGSDWTVDGILADLRAR